MTRYKTNCFFEQAAVKGAAACLFYELPQVLSITRPLAGCSYVGIKTIGKTIRKE